MKTSTFVKIVKNYNKGDFTYMGKYTYYVQYDTMGGFTRVIRCPRDKLHKEWFNGSFVTNYWEWRERIPEVIWGVI